MGKRKVGKNKDGGYYGVTRKDGEEEIVTSRFSQTSLSGSKLRQGEAPCRGSECKRYLREILLCIIIIVDKNIHLGCPLYKGMVLGYLVRVEALGTEKTVS